MSKRAVRRHHANRIKQQVAGYNGGYAREAPRQLGRLARARTPWSCVLCSNARRWFVERSLQERRLDRHSAEVDESRLS